MPSKHRPEGYLLIDDRASGQGMFESATNTCSHCQRIIVLNPLRTRERGYCPGCDSYICDTCEAARVAGGYTCMPMAQVFDEEEERILRHGTMVSS